MFFTHFLIVFSRLIVYACSSLISLQIKRQMIWKTALLFLHCQSSCAPPDVLTYVCLEPLPTWKSTELPRLLLHPFVFNPSFSLLTDQTHPSKVQFAQGYKHDDYDHLLSRWFIVPPTYRQSEAQLKQQQNSPAKRQDCTNFVVAGRGFEPLTSGL